MRRRELSIPQILAWADFYHERTGQWPKRKTSRFVYNSVGEKWYNIDMALRRADRGLPYKSSLAQLLAEHRGVRNSQGLPSFQESTILIWADAFYGRCHKWPTMRSGPIPEASGETWCGLDAALRKGLRGLPGKSSLAAILAEQRGVRNVGRLPPLTIKLILSWADAYYRLHKRWPTPRSGSIALAPTETWGAVHCALKQGGRGLPKGSSLAQLLERCRGSRNIHHLPRLTYRKILRWAESHHKRTGKWPTRHSGAIRRRRQDRDLAPGESWRSIDTALYSGSRGLPGGLSLARLLETHRSVRNKSNLPRLTYRQVLRWADTHHRRTCRWPCRRTGVIPETRGETWAGVIWAFYQGTRGLTGYRSFAQFLSVHRGVRNKKALPRITNAQILSEADRFHRLTGRWPNARSGSLHNGNDESWMKVDNALRLGLRGLPKGSSLFRFLKKHRSISNSNGGFSRQ
jgi:hypothetical protein